MTRVGAGGKISKEGRLVCIAGKVNRGGRGGGNGQSTRGGGSGQSTRGVGSGQSTRGGGSGKSTRGGGSGQSTRGGGSGQSTRGGGSTLITRGGRGWHVPRVGTGRGGQDTRGDAERRDTGALGSVEEDVVSLDQEDPSGLPGQDNAHEAATGGDIS